MSKVKSNTRKTPFWVCEPLNLIPAKIRKVKVATNSFFFIFFSKDDIESFVLRCFIAKPKILKYEKSASYIKTSINKNKVSNENS